ncbi:hypothetical protein ACVIU7_003452 [Bradyrhizobium liaoningense]|nr:hypothetical protein GCM10007858_05860 [Bradyrhizobium liaoningense]
MSDQARSTVGQRPIGRAGQKRANLDLDRPGKQVPRAGTNDIGQWIINRGRLTESKNIGSLGMAYRSPREVLAGSSPASIRGLPHTVITQIPP